MLRFILLFFSIFSSLLVFSQTKDTLFCLSKKPKKPVDSNYIHSYREYLTVGVFTATPINTLTFTPTTITDTNNVYTTSLQSNISNSLGFTLAFRSIYFALGFRIPLDPESKSSKGQTYFNNLGLRFNNPRFLLSIDSRKIKGYYYDLNSYKTVDDKTVYQTNETLSQSQFSIRGVYNFNWRKYSLLAPVNYTQRQVKTKIGFLLNVGFSKNKLSSDTTLVDITTASVYKSFNNAYQLNYTSLKVGPGIGLNFVLRKRIYLSLMMFLSVDNIFYSIHSNNQLIEDKYTKNMYTEGRASLGYQSKRFYVALKYVGDKIEFKSSDMKYENNLGIVTLDFGYRFKAPGILKKAYNATLTRFLGM